MLMSDSKSTMITIQRQIRSFALNLAFLFTTRHTMNLDASGTTAAAHAIILQFTQLGLFMVLSLGSVAAVIIPQYSSKSETNNDNHTSNNFDLTSNSDVADNIGKATFPAHEEGARSTDTNVKNSAVKPSLALNDDKIMNPYGILLARRSSDRLLLLGLILGISIGILQLMCLPLLKYVTPIEEVRAIAAKPFLLA